jgi:hypothetical protein
MKMKIKTIINHVKPENRWNSDTFEETTLISISKSLPLGNNFTLEHLVQAIFETVSHDDFERLYESVIDNVIISYKTSCGKGKEYLCGFDFGCFFKEYYEAI